MKVEYGEGKTNYGPGISVKLTGDEIALAIQAYLLAHGVSINGPRVVRVNGQACESGEIYVDPLGSVITDKEWFSGCGPDGGLHTGSMHNFIG